MNTDIKRILVTRDFPDKGIERLKERAGFKVTLWDLERPMAPEELVEGAKSHDALLCTLSDRIDKAFLDACAHLEIISQYAVGYDNIDVAYADSLGIPVGYTPDAMTEATADISFGLMIATARQMFFMHKIIIEGQWGHFRPKGNMGVLGQALKGRTLGIYGMGRIGLCMAQRCHGAYGMNVLYWSRSSNAEAEKTLGAVRVEFDELLAQSDVVSAHCALTPDTRHVFNRAAFKRMKPTGIFINTARGPIHDEAALLEALETGEIWGAGLDVTDPEPMAKDHPLLSMPNVCVLPHIGSATKEARELMSVMAAENIIQFYDTGEIPHQVSV